MRGQLDIQFQWIYVLVAGGTFLLLFFLAFKACTAGNEERIESAGVRTAATLLSTAVWEQAGPGREVSIQAQASCVAGTLTLTQGDSRAQIQRTAAFIPPTLNGKTRLIVQPVAHEADGIPAITYGNVLYVLDSGTHYYTLDEPVPGGTGLAAPEDFKDISVPDGAKTLVLVTSSSRDLSNVAVPRTGAAVYAVAARPDGTLDFYARSGQVLRKTQNATYAGNRELKLGAMIAATPENYRCAKSGFVERARDIAAVYVARSDALVDEGMPQACADQHMLASGILGAQMGDDQFIAALRDGRLLSAQTALNAMDCPVIA